jgi:hypothetical protein
MLYHPSHHVPDLAGAEHFFERVFGRPSTPLSALGAGTAERPGPDHSTFTPIADVLFDSIDPRRYVVADVQRYETVTHPQLKGLGWYVDEVDELYRSLREHGFTVVDQLDRVARDDDPPSAAGAAMPLFFTDPGDAGLRHEFVPRFPFPLDPRQADGWQLPAVSERDPLGIVRCAAHTVVTQQPERALRLAVDVMGGEVVHQGRDELLGATTTTVSVADALLEYSVPDAGTAALAELRATSHRSVLPDANGDGAAPFDRYHSITWQVVDLDRVERHLRTEGVAILSRTDTTIAVDPTDALGIPWRFTTADTPSQRHR